MAGVLLWLVAWLAQTADLLWAATAVTASMRGAPLPTELSELDGAVAQLLGTAGLVMIGAALACAIAERRARRAAVALLAFLAGIRVLGTVVHDRLQASTDLDRIARLHVQRTVIEVIAALALACVLWLYRSDRARSALPRAVSLTPRG